MNSTEVPPKQVDIIEIFEQHCFTQHMARWNCKLVTCSLEFFFFFRSFNLGYGPFFSLKKYIQDIVFVVE